MTQHQGQQTELLPNNIELRTNIAHIAASLAAAAGAQNCYVSLTGMAGQQPRLLVASDTAHLPSDRIAEISPLLRTNMARKSVPVSVGGLPGLSLPLSHDKRHVGSAVLVFAPDAKIDQPRVLSAAALAAMSLDMMRQVAALHLHAEEIEERARLREIQVSRNLIRGVIDSIPLGLVLLNDEGTVLAANRALSTRFGLDPSVLVGMHYGAAIGPWNDSPAARVLASGTPERMRRSMTRPDGGQILLEIACFPLRDSDARTYQVVEVWEDITERVALQTQLIRAEKLAAIGQLAASIAHEVGNPLQAIQGFLMLFLEQSTPDMLNRNYLELAQEEIERIVRVISRLRDLYRPCADVVARVEVNDLVDGVLLLTGKQLERANVRVVRTLDPALPPIQAVADQLKQVLLNLVLNAIDAMSSGGKLHVVTSSDLANEAVIITITDYGMGIPEDQLAHIFDGLHTTKERGMGLGLYTSKAIIERHLGRITASSAVGAGTTFTIVLPTRVEEADE